MMPEYLKQILHTQLFSVMNILVGIISIILMIKYLQVSEYGEYVLIQGFMAFACLIFSQNIFSYSRLQISGADEAIQYGYLKTVLILVLGGYTVTLLALHILGVEKQVLFFFEIEIQMVPFLLVMLVLELVNSELMRFFIATKKIIVKNYAQFAQKLAVLTGILVLVFSGIFNLFNFLYVFILGQLVVFVILGAKVSIIRFYSSPFMKDVIKKGYSVALPLIPVGLMSVALNYTDTLMIAKFIDKKSVAQYGFASQIIAIAMMVIGTSIVLTLFPYAVEAHNRHNMVHRKNYFSKMFDYSFYLAVLFYFFVNLNAKTLIAFSGFDHYKDVSYYLLFLGVFPVFQGIYNVSSHYLQLLKVYSAQAIIAIFIITTNVVLNYYFISFYGVIGVAYASLISFILLSGISVVILCCLNQDIRSLLQKKSFGFLFILVVSFLFAYFFRFFSFSIFIVVGLNALILGAIFLLFIFLKRRITL